MIGLLAGNVIHSLLSAGVHQGDVAVRARCEQRIALTKADHLLTVTDGHLPGHVYSISPDSPLQQ